MSSVELRDFFNLVGFEPDTEVQEESSVLPRRSTRQTLRPDRYVAVDYTRTRRPRQPPPPVPTPSASATANGLQAAGLPPQGDNMSTRGSQTRPPPIVNYEDTGASSSHTYSVSYYGTSRTNKSKGQRSSSTISGERQRRKKDADLESVKRMLSIDEEEAEAEAAAIAAEAAAKVAEAEAEAKKAKAQAKLASIRAKNKRIIEEKSLALQKQKTADEFPDDNSQRLSSDEEEVAVIPVIQKPAPANVKISKRSPEINSKEKCETWLNQTESPAKTEKTLEKILVRQTIGKDLPIFSGEPAEWPGFYEEYKRSTEMCSFSDGENLYRLRKCLRGKAKESVQAMMIMPENVSRVMETLKMNFGRSDFIIQSLIDKAKQVPSPKEDRFDSMVEFGNAVRNLVMTMESLNSLGHMMNPELLRALANKLPGSLKMSWGGVLAEKNFENVTLKDFMHWIDKKAKAASAFNFPSSSSTEVKKDFPDRKGGKPNKQKETVFASSEEKSTVTMCTFCTKSGHAISVCRGFLKEPVNKRWEWVKEKKVCFSCLENGHQTLHCQKKAKCGQEGCAKLHHKILHSPPKPKNIEEEEEQKLVGHISECKRGVLLRVAPVILKGPKGEIKTYAMFDDASTVSIIEENTAKILGLTGKQKPLCMQWTNGITTDEKESHEVQLGVKGYNCKEFYTIPYARTVKRLQLNPHSVPVKKYAEKWKHLQGLDLLPMKNARPTILIGEDNATLTVAREVREGPPNAPLASRCKLGWVLHGPVNQFKNRVDGEFTYHIHEKESEDIKLHQLIKESFRIENFGVKLTNSLLSKEEKRTQELTEQTTKRIGNRYETGLLWKRDDITLPESKTMALNRLMSIEKKMDRNSEFAQWYCDKIADYCKKGYARKLSDKETIQTGPLTWYLPHFVVYNVNKPDKPRLVFDAAAKSRDTSLNDNLLKGMDLLNPLPAVLCKFRQGQIPFSADIKEMFHQVRIRKEDQGAQRFLWRGMERNKPPEVYQMEVMIFGAVSSPYSAQEVKNRNARHCSKNPETIKAIVENHYMDDYLASCDSIQEAQELISDVIQVHRKGGFEICNWCSSSREVLENIPECLRSKENKSLSEDKEMAKERVLGLHWDPNSDTFTFKTNFLKVDPDIVSGSRRPTKREMLKLVMSVYDPLGFLALFVVKAKILLQDVWRAETGWDEEISPELYIKWDCWLEELQGISEFRIPRCYFANSPARKHTQLHVFCDASEKAYSAVAYFRMDTEDAIDTAFVMAKTRVAPIKAISMPRMELQAALMGSRLGDTIKKQHDIKIDAEFYWTDSTTILYWLRSEKRRRQFEAPRLGEIEELTNLENWKWVPTKENVADIATRDEAPSDFGQNSKWIIGPEFLRKGPAFWPVENKKKTAEAAMELEMQFVAVTTVKEPSPINLDRFSSFLRLLRTAAYVLRFVKNSRKKRAGRKFVPLKDVPEIDVDELKESEDFLIALSQRESFGEEIDCLKKKKELPKSSRLNQLSPALNKNGLLVLHGRIDAAPETDESTKHPIILDPKHRFTRLLIDRYHNLAGHHGRERVLNDMRQKFWIFDLRTAIKSSWSRCQVCKIARATPQNPKMGPLPAVRITRTDRPFIVTGLDYFGPIEVTVKRSREKRYGALFTCMVTRAVHLEVANSLSADSAIQAITRFCCRRGTPREIHSDNGTNFHGADNEMKKVLQEWDQNKIKAELTTKGIKWVFISPSAPFQGGAWERLVRSVKIALMAVLGVNRGQQQQRTVSEETLRTAFALAEFSVNSRPLTHVSVDPDDPESLTPNHFLLGSSTGECWAGSGRYAASDLWGKAKWKAAQRLADTFWQRWLKEFLPSLVKRSKWHRETVPVKVGDLVFIADSDMVRNSWPRGRVVGVFPGKDGIVRNVDVKTNTGIYRRPVHKLAVIRVEPEVELNADQSTGGGMLETRRMPRKGK